MARGGGDGGEIRPDRRLMLSVAAHTTYIPTYIPSKQESTFMGALAGLGRGKGDEFKRPVQLGAGGRLKYSGL